LLVNSAGQFAESGGVTASSVDASARSGITLDGSVTTSGTFTANADSDNNGTGTFTVAAGKSVITNSHSLSITAADLVLNGSLDSGTATTSLHATNGEAIGLGNTVIPGGFNVSGAELGNITAAELDLGDSTSGNITVNGITAAESANIGLVVLDASGSGHTLLFTGNASTFQNITGTADADISVNAGLTATPGNISLTSNGTLTVNQPIATPPGTGGTLTVIGGVVINAAINVGAGNVTLQAAAGQDIIITVPDVSATKIDLEAPRDIIIAALVETTSPGSDISLIADSNHDGVGGVWITSTGQVVSAANVFIQGSSLYGLEFSATPPSGSVIVDANATPGKDSIVAAGSITIQNSTFAPAGANIVLDGAVTSTVAQDINVTSKNQIDLDTKIKSAGGNIEFHSPVVLTSPTTVISNDKGASGGNVTFDSTVDSATATAEDVTVTAGTGNVTFTSAVGAQHEVGALLVTSAGKFLESAGITATAVDVTAATDITLDGSVTTTGAVTAQAGNNITQASGTTVDAGSAPVGLTATGGNVTLSHVVTTNTVLVRAGESIINGLAPNVGENITAAATGLSANTGIGDAQPLETSVGTLAAKNSSSGNITVNNVGGPLVIGTVGTIAGIENDAPLGNINVTNAGALTVDPPVLSTQGGSIVLTSTPGPANNLTINAPVRATGGNGNVVLNAGNDLVVNGGGSGPDIQTQGMGTITGTAQNVVIFNGNVLIQSGTGAITQLSPNLTNVQTPELTAQGIATVTGDYSEPGGAHDYIVVVNWHDGTTSTQTFAGASSSGSFVFTHFYSANPDAANNSTPIPVTVTVFNDPNITFSGLLQPPVTTPPSGTPSQTVGDGFNTVNSQITVPGTGLGFINIAQAGIVISQLQFTPPNTLALSPVIVPVQANFTQFVSEQTSQFEDVTLEERQVKLQVLDPNGKVTEEVVMDEQVLDDLPGLFRKLPDGHYRVFLKEPGEVSQRLLLDVHLRGGKPVDESEEGQGLPPDAGGGAVPGADAQGAAPAPISDDQATTSTATESRAADALPARAEAVLSRARTAAVVPAGATLSDDRQVTNLSAGPPDAAISRPRATYAGLLSAGALAACVGDDWQARVHAALAAAGPQMLSKVSRLVRRLRRPSAREAGGRLSRRRRRGSHSEEC
jgi:hypothetical protein